MPAIPVDDDALFDPDAVDLFHRPARVVSPLGRCFVWSFVAMSGWYWHMFRFLFNDGAGKSRLPIQRAFPGCTERQFVFPTEKASRCIARDTDQGGRVNGASTSVASSFKTPDGSSLFLLIISFCSVLIESFS